MKICFVSPKVYPYFDEKVGHSGGAEHQLYYLGTKLAQDEHYKISFASADYGQAKIENFGKLKVWNAFSFSDNKLKSFVDLIKTLKRINADIYIFRSPSANLFAVFFILKFFLRKKILYMVASEPESSPQKLKLTVNFLAWKSIELAYKLSSFIVVQNNEQEENFYKYRKLKKIKTLRSFFEIKQIGQNHAATEILWVGRGIPLKQPDIFIDLAKAFPYEQFRMVCPKHTDEKYWKSIHENAVKVPNLIFHDYVEPKELKEYFYAAKIYVITSTSEGMPNTMMEAAQYNCAILSLNINPDNLIGKYNLGFFTKEEDELKKLLQVMLSDNEKLNGFQENGIRFLNTWHNPEKVISGFKEIIERLLK